MDFDDTLYNTNGDFLSPLTPEKIIGKHYYDTYKSAGIHMVLCSGREVSQRHKIIDFLVENNMPFNDYYFWNNDSYTGEWWYEYWKYKFTIFDKYVAVFGRILVIDDDRHLFEMSRKKKNIDYILAYHVDE